MLRRSGGMCAMLIALPAMAADAQASHQAIEQALARESRLPVQVHWDAAVQRPRLISGAFAVPAGGRSDGVLDFLRRHATQFRLGENGLTLELTAAREGLAGTYLRYAERMDKLPVFAGEVVALTRTSAAATEIRLLNLAQFEVRRPDNLAASIDAADAVARARAAIGVAAVPVFETEAILGIDPVPPAALAYRVRFRAAQPTASWEAFVDAGNGHVRSFRDRIVHASGTGLVFDPNPVATTGDTSLVDNNDTTSPTLDAARYSVSIPRLDGSGFLRGAFVDARPSNAAQRAQDAGLSFNFDRNDDRFEEVMAYFHIDRAQNRIQTTLGFNDVNNRVQVAIVNANNGDNSSYDPGAKAISYGSGGVDDAEDADILIHEYGHAIQDNQVPGYGGGDEGAMGEGFGDYLAGSMNAVLSSEVADANCIADWDSTAYSVTTPPCLRRLDSTKHYPEFVAGEVHEDGEMWSAALFKSRATLGADTMDRLVLESHFLLSTNESFASAVDAVIAADLNLHGGANAELLRKNFVEQGLSREITPAAPPTSVLQSIGVSIDNPRDAGSYANHLDDSQTFTQPGAAALRVHFTQIGTEVDESCLEGACDNIYIYDAQGRLFQILNGSPGATTSLAIPGETVRIRLVSDGSIGGFGYHADGIDVLAADGIFADDFE